MLRHVFSPTVKRVVALDQGGLLRIVSLKSDSGWREVGHNGRQKKRGSGVLEEEKGWGEERKERG